MLTYGPARPIPTGKKADIRAQIDRMKDCGTVESAWGARETRARSTVRPRCVHFIMFFCLVMVEKFYHYLNHSHQDSNWLLYQYIERMTGLHLCRPRVGATIMVYVHHDVWPRRARFGLLIRYRLAELPV